MPDAPTAIQGAWSASAATPGSIQGAFTVSAATPGSIAGAFTVSASTPGSIQGAFTASAATPGSIQGAFAVSAATPGSIQGAFTASAASPGRITYTPPTLKAATLLVEFSGNTHQFLLTATTPGANANLTTTFEIEAVSAGYETSISVVDTNIVVSPKTKAMMLISGTTPACEPRVLYNNDGNGIPGFGLWYESEEGTGTILFALSGKWYLQHLVDGQFLYAAEKTSSNTTPEGLTGWTVVTGSGQPTITAAGTSVRQVVDLVNATTAARALVTASETGYAFGEVSVFAETGLNGGEDWPARSTPGTIKSAFTASASAPGAIQAAWSTSPTTPGAIA